MSDMSQGVGWWQASDSKWYAPERHPDYVAAPVPAAPVPPPVRAAPIAQATMAQALAGQSTVGHTTRGHPPGTAHSYADAGGLVLTLDREITSEPAWRPGSKRTAADTEVGSGTMSSTPPGSGTVSSQVPALRLFIYLIVGASTFQALVLLALRGRVGNALALLSHQPSGISHSLVLLAYVAQALMIVNVLFLLALLLSRSFSTVTTLLAISLALGIVTVVLSAAGRSYFNSGWALVSVLYIAYVRGQVRDEGTRASFHEGDHKRYSLVEAALAGYIVLVTIGFGALTLSSYRSPLDTSSGPATIAYPNGATSTGPASDPAPTAYVEQTVSAHDFKVTLRFDPNSSAVVDYQTSRPVGTFPLPGIDRVAITGDQLNSTSQIVVTVTRLGPVGTAPADAPPCQPVGHVGPTDVSIPVTIMGHQTSVCGRTDQAVANFAGTGGEYELTFTPPVQLGTLPPMNALVIGAIADSVNVG